MEDLDKERAFGCAFVNRHNKMIEDHIVRKITGKHRRGWWDNPLKSEKQLLSLHSFNVVSCFLPKCKPPLIHFHRCVLQRGSTNDPPWCVWTTGGRKWGNFWTFTRTLRKRSWDSKDEGRYVRKTVHCTRTERSREKDEGEEIVKSESQSASFVRVKNCKNGSFNWKPPHQAHPSSSARLCFHDKTNKLFLTMLQKRFQNSSPANAPDFNTTTLHGPVKGRDALHSMVTSLFVYIKT